MYPVAVCRRALRLHCGRRRAPRRRRAGGAAAGSEVPLLTPPAAGRCRVRRSAGRSGRAVHCALLTAAPRPALAARARPAAASAQRARSQKVGREPADGRSPCSVGAWGRRWSDGSRVMLVCRKLERGCDRKRLTRCSAWLQGRRLASGRLPGAQLARVVSNVATLAKSLLHRIRRRWAVFRSPAPGAGHPPTGAAQLLQPLYWLPERLRPRAVRARLGPGRVGARFEGLGRVGARFQGLGRVGARVGPERVGAAGAHRRRRRTELPVLALCRPAVPVSLLRASINRTVGWGASGGPK